MPNYAGKFPLIMECPHCRFRGSHSVVSTEPPELDPPEMYQWARPIVERWTNTPFTYRGRLKQCDRCHKEFETVEMSEVVLFALMSEIRALSKQLAELKRECELQSQLMDDARQLLLARYKRDET